MNERLEEATELHTIRIYRDAQGNQPVKKYLLELAGKTDKDSRIQLAKIDYYLEALRNRGTRVGEPFVKHIDGDIWELRPLSDRFFFIGWDGNKFILLHHSTKKTPPHEMQKVKSILKDFIKRSDNKNEK